MLAMYALAVLWISDDVLAMFSQCSGNVLAMSLQYYLRQWPLLGPMGIQPNGAIKRYSQIGLSNWGSWYNFISYNIKESISKRSKI